MNYEVLACMKRNKIEKDFRSNVSLGATTDEYKLSKEQEEIVRSIKESRIQASYLGRFMFRNYIIL